jgi:hypothetical protein
VGDDQSEFLSLLVGATVPSGNGRFLALSWPMVRPVVREENLALRFRANWARGLAHAVSSGKSGDRANGLLWWSASASDITKVRVASRSCLVTSTSGDCCFGFPSYLGSANEKWQRVQAELSRLDLALEYAPSNFWKRNEMKPGR